MNVQFSDPTRITLLQHIFASLLRRGLADPAVARKVAGLGRIGVEAGGMAITADFGPDAVTLSLGREGVRGWVAGSLEDMMNVCLTGAVVGPWLLGKVRAGGNVFALLKLLAVLKAARQAPVAAAPAPAR